MSHDTLLHRILRQPVGALVDTPVTPDMLTTLRLATGLGAACCFAYADGLMTLGAGLFLLSILLDRADGELARQSGQFSRIGPRFDLVSDCLATMAAFIGLGIGVGPSLPLDPSLLPLAGPVLGLSGAISVATIFTQLNGLSMRVNRGDPVLASPRLFDPDDAMLVLPVLIWCGGAVWVLLASGLVTPLAAILLGVTRSGHQRRSPATEPDGPEAD